LIVKLLNTQTAIKARLRIIRAYFFNFDFFFKRWSLPVEFNYNHIKLKNQDKKQQLSITKVIVPGMPNMAVKIRVYQLTATLTPVRRPSMLTDSIDSIPVRAECKVLLIK